MNALINARLIVNSVCLFLTFTFIDVYAQREDRFHEDKNHKIGKLWVHVTNFGQLGTDSGRTAVWPGADILSGFVNQYINRGGWFFGGIVPSDDTQGRDLNAPGDLDTLVAEGFSASAVDVREMFPHFKDERSAIEVRSTVPNSEFFHQGAISGDFC